MRQLLMFPGIALALLCATISSGAKAETLNIEVPANRTTEVYRMVLHVPRLCRSAQRPEFNARHVEHGKLVAKPGSYVIPSGECKGRRLNGTSVYYTPDPGFRGIDKVKISFKMDRYYQEAAGYQFRSVTLNITVK